MHDHVTLVRLLLNSSLLHLLHPHVVLERGFILDLILVLLELEVRPTCTVSASMFLMVVLRRLLLMLVLGQISEI